MRLPMCRCADVLECGWFLPSMDRLAPLLGPLCALGSSITWALAASVYTQTAGRIGAASTNFFRAVIVLPLFVVTAAVLHGPQAFLALSAAQVGWLALSTLCSYALGDLLFYMAALRLGTPTALAIASSYPAWAALSGALTLGEAVSPQRIVGTLLCIVGVAWLVLQQRTAEPARPSAAERPASRRRWLLGIALAFATSLFWAGNTYTIRRGSIGQPLLVVNALRYLMALAVLSLLRRLDRPVPAKDPAEPALTKSFLVTVFVEAFGGSSIFVYALAHSELSVAAPLSSLAPLFSVPIGLWLGNETLSVRRLLAIALIVSGVVLLVS